MPDGTEEVVEGTPEEIAEYEKQLREGKQPPPPQKPVLYGAPAVDGVELSDAEILYIRLQRAAIIKPIGTQPYTTPPHTSPFPWNGAWNTCPVCGMYACTKTHITYGLTKQ